MDADTRLIVGSAIGPRDKETAEELWYSLPPEYRQQAVCFTDFYQVYARILPSKRHKAVGKGTGKTAHMLAMSKEMVTNAPPAGFHTYQMALQQSVAQAVADILMRLYWNFPIRRRRRTPELDARDSSIRDLFANGVHPNEIAARYGISPERVYQIIKLTTS